jgi:hypothetical protein
MLFFALLLLALSALSLVAADIVPPTQVSNPSAGGMIDLQPLTPQLLSDTNQYVPERRNKFHWEVQRPIAKPCDCPEASCPGSLLDKQSVSLQCDCVCMEENLTSYRSPTAGSPTPQLATNVREALAQNREPVQLVYPFIQTLYWSGQTRTESNELEILCSKGRSLLAASLHVTTDGGSVIARH